MKHATQVRYLFASTLAAVAAGCAVPSGGAGASASATAGQRAALAETTTETTECPDFATRAARRQEEDVWCWAACAEMVSLHYDPRSTLTQEAIVTQIQGLQRAGMRPRAAMELEVAGALDPEGWAKQRARLAELTKPVAADGQARTYKIDFDPGAVVRMWVGKLRYGPREMVIDLRANDPVIVGFKPSSKTARDGHVCVVFGAEYVATRNNPLEKMFRETLGESPATSGDGYKLASVRYVDPWEGTVEKMSAEEFNRRRDFTMSRAGARRAVEEWNKALQVAVR